MTPAEWARIKCIFDEAAELPVAERELFLTQACAGDPVLLAEVRSLLSALDDAGDFIQGPAPGQDRALTTLAADPAFHTGASIGPYRRSSEKAVWAWSIRPFAWMTSTANSSP
jgi:hypothetical protein